MLLALLFLIASSAKADWFRTQSGVPLPHRNQFFVATYTHRGPIDYSIAGSQFSFFLTLVYDFSRIPMIVYAVTTSGNLSENQAQDEAEQWLIRVESERIRGVSRRLYIDASFVGEEDDVQEIQPYIQNGNGFMGSRR
jgi:hypothetical protein